MENLSVALKHVSQALDLDSNGFHQAAFSKYLESFQALVFYLNSLFMSIGFKKMIDQKKEVFQVLSMIHECSDRISVILNDYGKPPNTSFPSCSKYKTNTEYHSFKLKNSAFDKIQKENIQLFKFYKMRLEKANDKNIKTSLTLEFHRRLAENAVLAKSKFELAVKKLQKERVQHMENAVRKLSENCELLNEMEKDKRQLYNKVLEYIKTEIWPISLKLNSYDLTTLEIVEKVYYKILRCCEHPLTQWLILVQTNVKRKIDVTLKEYQEYIVFLPDLNSKSNYSVEEHKEKIIIRCQQLFVEMSSTKLLQLEETLSTITSEIRNVIESTVEIFFLIYKSFLPEESEAACYHTIEMYFLKPLWSNLFTLFRVQNLPTEYKTAEIMFFEKSSTPAMFGIPNGLKITEICTDSIALLKTLQQHQSVMNKLRTLVQVIQKICECESIDDRCKRKLGTDEMIPVLCYVIIQSKLAGMISECHLLECLFDMRYMLGEEGFALSSFQTALKCIEIKKLTEHDNTEEEK